MSEAVEVRCRIANVKLLTPAELRQRQPFLDEGLPCREV